MFDKSRPGAMGMVTNRKQLDSISTSLEEIARNLQTLCFVLAANLDAEQFLLLDEMMNDMEAEKG